ncbi:MAG TPA: F0F1 ATP synthase subunit A [Anaerolineales bacterium]|nr:F0F1 ATP synthase subunit A [Anaerolineales bacterium]
MEQTEKKPRKIHRYFFLLVIIASVFFMRWFSPIMPHIQLPAEAVFPLEGHAPLFTFAGQGFYITNTMISVWLAMLIIIIIAWNIRKQIKRGDMVLTGVSGAIAALLEGFYGMTESTAGKYAKKIFPWFATIFLLVLFVNLQELVPGPDAFGYLHESEHGYPKQALLGGAVETIVEPDAAEDHGESEHGYALVPFWRVASTDLNFTASLAIISVVMTQVVGLQALGAGYLTKYFDIKPVIESWKKPGFGNPMDFIIGLVKLFASILEIIAEISKILSFTFRLFGVIFAGSVLLFFLGSMTGGLGQSIAVLLEMLFGPLQALVFGMLTMMFMSMATVSHGDHDHEEGHH